MWSRADLAQHFTALGVSPADTVMLHASVKAVGEVAGGPDQIHLALKDALTAEGTLVMYAACSRYYDEVGRGNLTADEEQAVLQKLPPFDPLTDRSARDHGILVEFLRTYPGSLVNRHLARFVVWGRAAAHLVEPQPWNYAFGAGSLLDRFLHLNGKILLMGSDHDAVTFLHYVEHVANIAGKRVARYKVPALENGVRVWRDQEEFDTADGAHANWPDRFFARITDSYLDASGNRGALVGNARSYLLPAEGLLCFSLPIMSAIAADATAADQLLTCR